MEIPKRFRDRVTAHLLGNMLEVDNYPLILSIIGKPGMGKTWQLRKHLELLGVQVFSVSSADLESERAGAPAKLIKQQYVNASVNISKKIPSALIIDDIDTTVGEWEQNTGTVNHQNILAFLMHLADNPYYIENVGEMNRVPIFFTGNKFELLYEPLRRPGRMLKFDWEPTKDEKIDIISSYFSDIPNNREVAVELVNLYPAYPISFFTDFFAVHKLEVLVDLASNATLKCILNDWRYKKHLCEKYKEDYNKIDWIKLVQSENVRSQKDGKDNN